MKGKQAHSRIRVPGNLRPLARANTRLVLLAAAPIAVTALTASHTAHRRMLLRRTLAGRSSLRQLQRGINGDAVRVKHGLAPDMTSGLLTW